MTLALALAVINAAFMFINARGAALRWAEDRHGMAGMYAASFAFSTLAFAAVVFP